MPVLGDARDSKKREHGKKAGIVAELHHREPIYALVTVLYRKYRRSSISGPSFRSPDQTNHQIATRGTIKGYKRLEFFVGIDTEDSFLTTVTFLQITFKTCDKSAGRFFVIPKDL